MNFSILTEFPSDIETEWNAILDKNPIHVPFLRFRYQKIWWETRGGGEWPDAALVLIIARVDGRLAGIAPLFASSQADGIPALFNIGSIEVSDYLDLLVVPEYEAEFIAGLLNFLPGQPLPAWKNLNFYNLIDSSPSLHALQTACSISGWKLDVEKLEHSPFIQLPGDWETYLAGIDKKQRHEIRRKMRRADESDIPVRWYFVEDAAHLDEEIDAFLELMKNDADKVAFLKPEMQSFLHKIVRCAFEEKCLQLAFLEVGGQKAAAYLSFDYLNRIWVYNSGLNREFQNLSPGWVLLGHLLKWAIENGRSEFDFMRGDEDYKYRFGSKDRFVVRAVLTPPEK
jgi:CelD/BcsL family acetyltransferase involved in cellulose biosynthesis